MTEFVFEDAVSYLARQLRAAADQVEREHPDSVGEFAVRARVAEVSCPGPEGCLLAQASGDCTVTHRELLPGMDSPQ